MCGISGFYLFREKLDPSKLLMKMTDVVTHRGPDSEGYFCSDLKNHNYFLGSHSRNDFLNLSPSKGLFLGHRRLSIIDLTESGTQPLKKHELTLVFNGEIYNYLELKEELINQGIEFHTTTDTEVILSAYHVWGHEAFKKFNGMWAIVIYDQENNRLILSRDRFGIKPLYYFLDNDQFVFSSEIKQILAYGIKPVVNKSVLDAYLQYDVTDYNDETFFNGIKSIPQSSVCSISLNEWPNQLETNYYYSLKFNEIKKKSSDLISKVDELLLDSVKLRLRSDVEVGSCLSGGLDSSTIVAVASQLHKESDSQFPFKTFTTTHEDTSIDETYYSKIVNKHTGSKGHYAAFESENFLDELRKLVYHQEEPFGSFSIYSSYKVMQSASLENIKVLLDGQGGDEVFLGYEIYYVEYLKYLLRKGRLISFINIFSIINKRSKLNSSSLIKYFIYFSLPRLRRSLKTKQLLKIKNATYDLSKFDLRGDYTDTKGFHSLYEKNLYQRIQHLLKFEDRNSMAFSIETRLPLLDYRIVDEMINSSPDQIFQDGWLKSVLRTVAKSKLPEEIVFRKDKYGFHAPEQELLEKIDSNFISKILLQDQIQTIFNVKKLSDLIDSKKELRLVIKAILLGMWFLEYDAKLS
jgi:asparagine synthase (glutamine-hydrolysing)